MSQKFGLPLVADKAFGSKPRVLIVDDVPENILILSETLKDDYSIRVANSGAKALEMACLTPPPELILLDIMMPHMNGYEVCSRLKKLPSCVDIPVIFVTAADGLGDEEFGLLLGGVDYITKPVQPSLVRARVKKHLELKRQRDQLEQEVVRRSEELVRARLAREVLENELRLALKLQMSILPKSSCSIPGVAGGEIATHMCPSRDIGGDLCDYIRVGPDRLLFALGDVSGKGVAAALFMLRVFALLHWLAPASRDPSRLLHDLNESLCQDNEACMFVTMVCGMIDLRNGEVLYSSGGHEPILLLTPGHPAEILDNPGGPALGLFEDAQFALHKRTMTPGQSLVLVSDGVTEANNQARQEFGLKRLLRALNENPKTLPRSVLNRCLGALQDFAAGAEALDDLTILVIQPFPEPAGAASRQVGTDAR